MSGWRQFKFDTSDVVPKSEDDCFIPEDDPMWQHVGAAKITSIAPQIQTKFDNSGNEKAKIMREQNIKPGTEEWIKLWFSKPK